MQDIIYGTVNTVIDDDTFIMNVTDTAKTNQYNYKRWEHIRILNLEDSKLEPTGDLEVKIKSGNAIQGKKVSCSVQTKDTYGRIVADVTIV